MLRKIAAAARDGVAAFRTRAASARAAKGRAKRLPTPFMTSSNGVARFEWHECDPVTRERDFRPYMRNPVGKPDTLGAGQPPRHALCGFQKRAHLPIGDDRLGVPRRPGGWR